MAKRVPVVVSIPPDQRGQYEGETVWFAIKEWYKRIGDKVSEGEAICKLEINKIETEWPAPASGTLIDALEADDKNFKLEGSEIGAIEVDDAI